MTSGILHNGEKVPKNCPVCGEKNNGCWIHLCKSCWLTFIDYWRKNHSNREILTCLPEYLAQLQKVKVEFT